jgi:hypothetical protein
MTPTLEYASPPTYRTGDRGRRLFCFGIALVMLGTVFVLGALIIVTTGLLRYGGFTVARGGTIMELVPPLLMCTAIGVGLLWTGISSIQLRRWVRPVVISFAGMLLASGVLMIATTALSKWSALAPPAPVMRRGPVARQAAEAETLAWISFGVLAFCMTVVPAIFLIGYRAGNVARTLDEADPQLGWSDGRPLPVLALALGLAYLAFLSLVLGTTGTVPWFGILLHGLLAMAAQTAWALAWLGAAWLVYRMNAWGPWLAIVLIAAAAASIALTISAAVMNDPRPPGQRWAYSDVTAQVQLSMVRAIIVVSIYALPAILYVLHARRRMPQ